MKPSHVASWSGTWLNDVSASTAKRSIFRSGHFVSPRVRGGRAYGTAVCRKPTHAVIPRMKRCRSRRLRNAATAFGPMRRKSPVSTGMSTFVQRRMSR